MLDDHLYIQTTESSTTLTEHDFLLFELDQDDHLYYNGSPVSIPDLPAILEQENPENPVLIRADRNCYYEAAVKIIDILKDAGLRRLALEVRKQPSIR